MSKIYIDPLNLGPTLIDTDDIMSQCEPYKLGSNWGGWKPYHNKIDWKKVHQSKDWDSICKKIKATTKGMPKTKKHNQNVSAAKKIRTHCCIICKYSFNPGNYTKHIKRACSNTTPKEIAPRYLLNP